MFFLKSILILHEYVVGVNAGKHYILCFGSGREAMKNPACIGGAGENGSPLLVVTASLGHKNRRKHR